MIIQHPLESLILELNQDQIILYNEDHPVLHSGPIPNILRSSIVDGSLIVETKSIEMIVQSRGAGFDLSFEPAGMISFHMDGWWFGHGEMIHQRLPLNRMMLPLSPFQTYDNGPDGQSCKLNPAWFSTKGVTIMAASPVNIGINQPPDDYPRYSWSLGAEKGPFSHRPFEDPGLSGDGMLTFSGKKLHLIITCRNGVKGAYHHLISEMGHPEQIPPVELFTKPTWTTWAKMKTEVSQDKVLQFAEQIIAHEYPFGVLEIDDRWQNHYGDLSFDPVKFPDPTRMIDILHARGFKVTAWVIPFIEPKSEAFITGRQNGYFVKDPSGEPCIVTWWQGPGALLDVTNPCALQWIRDNLLGLMEKTGLDGFKFDAGEACFIPEDAVFHQPISSNEYTNQYIQFISKFFQLTEVRSGWLNQSAPIFFRQWDKSSTWGADNGLQSLITGTLALGLTGYPFILPDMVGGNAYDEKPDEELMIRWTQANALLPAIQFSLPPWELSEECNRICRQYAWMHVEYAEQIIQLAQGAAANGDPIIRPIWWCTSEDELAFQCDDEFLLGDDLLVAPVMTTGARTRDIYLPEGKWTNILSGDEYIGKQVLRDFPASLETLPLFMRIKQAGQRNTLYH